MGKQNPLTCNHYWVTTKDKHVLQCMYGCGSIKIVEEPKISGEFDDIELEAAPLDDYEDSL